MASKSRKKTKRSGRRGKKADAGTKARPLGRGRKIAAVLTLFAAAFVLVSVVTFHPGDPPSTAVYPPNDPPKNLCREVGAYLAYWLLWALGDGAWPLLLFLLAAAMLWLSRKGVEDKAFRIAGALLLVTATSVLSSMIEVPGWPHLPEGHGGVLGLAIWQFLEPKLGPVGTVLMTTPVALVGLILLTNINLFAIPVWIWRWLRRRARPPVTRLASAAVAGAGAAATAIRSRASESRARRQTADNEDFEADEEEAEDTDESAEAATEESEPAAPPKPIVVRSQRNRTAEEPADSGEQQAFAFEPLPTTPRSADYKLPPVDLLEDPDDAGPDFDETAVRQKADVLTSTLHDFGVKARVVAIETGPVITQYELALAPGIKVSKVVGLSDDLAICLKAPSVRIVAPLPGKDTIGVEVPNTQRSVVRLKEIVLAAKDAPQRLGLPLFLGKDATGAALVKDLAAMPHLLIAGTTGSGKSVCLNAIIMSLLLSRTPDDLKLVLIDPKMVELSIFKGLPHLLCPVVNDMRKAEAILAWLVEKMDERYTLLSKARVRNINQYNRLSREQIVERFAPQTPEHEARLVYHMPHIVVIVDELADLMMVAAKEVEAHVTRLSQKSRAVGIHLVMATQRPSVDVLTGLIKSNLPVRISFQVASRIDSRTILDSMGAEKLLSQGDMLFMTPGAHKFIRAQGSYVSDLDTQNVLEFVTEEAEPTFHRELVQLKVEDSESGEAGEGVMARGCDDDMYLPAIEVVLEHQRGSVSLLQRRLGIGYGRAARLIDQMAEDGIVGTYAGSQAREVLITLEQWQAMNEPQEQDEAADDTDTELTPEEAEMET